MKEAWQEYFDALCDFWYYYDGQSHELGPDGDSVDNAVESLLAAGHSELEIQRRGAAWLYAVGGRELIESADETGLDFSFLQVATRPEGQ
jgi:hypothetical protein